jgi:hypothetical protein
MNVVIASLISAVLGGLVVHILESRRVRHERLFDRRAEVIAKLSEKLYAMQVGFSSFVHPYQRGDVDRKKQLQDANQAFDELRQYYFSNEIWLDPGSCAKIESFMEMAYTTLGDYVDDLNERGYPQTAEGRAAGSRISAELQPLRRKLEADFRAILYPQLWYQPLLQLLQPVQNRKTSESVADRLDGPQGPG